MRVGAYRHARRSLHTPGARRPLGGRRAGGGGARASGGRCTGSSAVPKRTPGTDPGRGTDRDRSQSTDRGSRYWQRGTRRGLLVSPGGRPVVIGGAGWP
eukprot:811769-Rhodomonas_salina.3